MDTKLSYSLTKDGYAYFVTLSVNRNTPTWLKTIMEDPNHKGMFLDIVGRGFELVEAISNMKAELKKQGII